MSTLTRGPRYYGGHAPEYAEEYGEEPEQEIHPHVRRRAEHIVHRCRLTRLRQWWISVVGGLTGIGAGSAFLLCAFGLLLPAAAVTVGVMLAALYLTSLALRPFTT